MLTKPGLTRMEHEELGKALNQLRAEVAGIIRFLETRYPNQYLCVRLSHRVAQSVDGLRLALDRQAFLDYSQWDAQEKAQFKGSRTYFPQTDTEPNASE